MTKRVGWRPYRFSLATLLISMTVAAFGCLWLRNYAFRPRLEAELVEELQTRHGSGISIAYRAGPSATDASYSPVWWFTEQTPVLALEIREDVRELSPRLFSTFTELRSVTIRAAPVTDRARRWKPVSEYAITSVYDGSYERLRAAEPLLTPHQWRDLARHPKVESLQLINQEIAIGHLDALRQNASLRHLAIINGRLNNQDAMAIGRLRQLESLSLIGQQLDGTTLGPDLTRFHSLHTLELRHCPLKDDLLEHIASMPSLERLSLSRTTVTNAGMRSLIRSPTLVHLSLEDTFVSYRAGDDLAAIPALKSLNLIGTVFDQEQLKSFAARVPHLTIECLVPNGSNNAVPGVIGAPSTGMPPVPSPFLDASAVVAAPIDKAELPPLPARAELPLDRAF